MESIFRKLGIRGSEKDKSNMEEIMEYGAANIDKGRKELDCSEDFDPIIYREMSLTSDETVNLGYSALAIYNSYKHDPIVVCAWDSPLRFFADLQNIMNGYEVKEYVVGNPSKDEDEEIKEIKNGIRPKKKEVYFSPTVDTSFHAFCSLAQISSDKIYAKKYLDEESKSELKDQIDQWYLASHFSAMKRIVQVSFKTYECFVGFTNMFLLHLIWDHLIEMYITTPKTIEFSEKIKTLMPTEGFKIFLDWKIGPSKPIKEERKKDIEETPASSKGKTVYGSIYMDQHSAFESQLSDLKKLKDVYLPYLGDITKELSQLVYDASNMVEIYEKDSSIVSESMVIKTSHMVDLVNSVKGFNLKYGRLFTK